MIDVVFDTETGDPDDFFTLCFLGSHPEVALRAVTVTPGTRSQVAVIRHVLERLGLGDVPVGARKPTSTKDGVSGFLKNLLGELAPVDPDELGHVVLADALAHYPEATLLTGAPLHNLGQLLAHHPEVTIQRWVGQGGFAGDNVVPPEHRLAKFNGRKTCPTYNFCGCPNAALAMLSSPRVLQRDLVSKNVCHGVVYDRQMHERTLGVRHASAGLELMCAGMEHYLRKHRGGKKFHDPLAACVMVNRSIATFEEVEVSRRGNQWGSKVAKGTDTFITIAVDQDEFFGTLTAH